MDRAFRRALMVAGVLHAVGVTITLTTQLPERAPATAADTRQADDDLPEMMPIEIYLTELPEQGDDPGASSVTPIAPIAPIGPRGPVVTAGPVGPVGPGVARVTENAPVVQTTSAPAVPAAPVMPGETKQE